MSSSTLDAIAAAQLQARKDRDSRTTTWLSTFLGEARMVGKNAGRDVTEEEVQQLLSKFVSNLNDNIRLLESRNATEDLLAEPKMERDLFVSFLPARLSDAELEAIIDQYIADLGATSLKEMKTLVGKLKQEHTFKYDPKFASELIRKKLSA